MKLIDKDALVAEIEKKLNSCKTYSTEYVNGKKHALKSLLSFIDTLEVKEVDSNDDFIEKACEFISLNVADYIDVTHKGGIEHLALRERFIEKFINYMKGE